MAKIVHRGRVTDISGQPLWGAHIITINSTPRRFATTDQDGYFAVEGELHESFEITYLGFKSQIFRLERYMTDKTYRMLEDAAQLDEVVVTPRNPTVTPQPKKTSGFDLGSIFATIGNVFGGDNNSGVFNTPPIAPMPTPKVPTAILPPVLRQDQPTAPVYNTPVPAPAPQTSGGITDWVKNNPLQAGGLALLAILAGTALVGKNKGEETTELMPE